MSITHQGYSHFVESKAKISNTMSGNKHPMFEKIGEKNPASKKVYIYLFDLKTKKIMLHKSFNT